MPTNRLSMTTSNDNTLGIWLKDRRARLDPAAFGIAPERRRTPGLRREEVAQRANVSTTWYTWLEQGRGGAPSVEVLERLAHALTLNTVEREHLFLLAQHRPPVLRYQTPVVSAQLQAVLDALPYSPAFIKNSMWDILAWNNAALKVLGDYSQIPAEQRNLLRMLFSGEKLYQHIADWPAVARFIVATFRADTARAGTSARADLLVAELTALNPEFAALWQENDVRNHGAGIKQINSPTMGMIHLHYSAFAVDGQPDLSMVVYTPCSTEDQERISALMARRD